MLSRAHSGEGIDELWTKIQEHREFLTASSELKRRRGLRRKEEFLETVVEELNRRCRTLVEEDPGLRGILEDVGRGKAEPYSAAMELLDSRSFLQSWPASLSG
jgi:LAO/AO transport system kinase